MKFRRIVYGLVGLSAVYGLIAWLMGVWNPLSMGLLPAIVVILLLIGGLDCGVVALTGKKDLLQILGLK